MKRHLLVLLIFSCGSQAQILAPILAGSPSVASSNRSKLLTFQYAIPSTSAHYVSPSGAVTGSTADLCFPVPTSGTFQNLYAALTSDPDAGSPGSNKGYIITLRTGASAGAQPSTNSNLAATILSNTSANNGGGYQSYDTSPTDAVHVNAGYCIDISVTATMSAPASFPKASWVLEFLADNPNETVMFGWSSAIGTTGTVWQAPYGDHTARTTFENQAYTLFPVAGTITAFYAQIGTTTGSGNTRTVQIRQTTGANAGTTTSPGGASITWSNAGGTGSTSNVSPALSVAAGDRIDLEWDLTGSPTASRATWGLVFTPTTPGQFIIPVSAVSTQLSNSSTVFNLMAATGVVPFNAESNAQSILTADMQLQGFVAWLDASPGGSGKQYTVSLRLTAGSPTTTFSTALTAQGPTASSTAAYSPPTNYGLFDTQIVPASTPTLARLTMSYIGIVP